jgi:glycosyltransferase involved in cell wall biosynthesis
VRDILFVDQYSDIGGGQRSLLALLRIALGAGLRTALLAPGGGPLESAVERTTRGRVEFYPLPEAGMAKGAKGLGDALALIAYTAQLLLALRRLRDFDVRYYNGPHAFLAGLIASRMFTGRSIYHVRIDYSRLGKWILWLIIRLSRNTTVGFNSPYLREVYARFDPVTADSPRVMVLENGLYPPFNNLTFEDRFIDSNGQLKAAVFGRVCPEKGQDRIVMAVQECPFLNVLLVGKCEKADRSYLDRIVADGRGRILHMEFVDDVPALVSGKRIQIAIVPSRWNEAFGLVAIESMAMSCLTFVSARGMLADIGARTGAIVFNSEQELVLKLQGLSTLSSEVLTEMARAQQRRVMEEFSYCSFAKEVTSVILEGASRTAQARGR